MRFKKTKAALLTMAFLCSMCIQPALAAGQTQQEERLAKVVLAVKRQVQIEDDYTKFEGNANIGAGGQTTWYLSWTKPDGELEISALEDGTIMSYQYYYGFKEDTDSFPVLAGSEKVQSSRVLAENFIKQVLRAQETAVFDTAPYRQTGNRLRYSGKIAYQGVQTPSTFQIVVEQNKVIAFDRNRAIMARIGTAPSPIPKISGTQAEKTLQETTSMRLLYVAQEKTSTLQYVPQERDKYYVDAQTGKLVNLTELESVLSATEEAGNVNRAAYDSASDAGLSDVEQLGVEQLKGTKSKQELDHLVKEISALDLKSYSLQSMRYFLQEDHIEAVLQYQKTNHFHKTVTLDAKTGILHSVSSWNDTEVPPSFEPKQKEKAEAFLRTYLPDEFVQTSFFEQPETQYFTYERQQNGYPVQNDALLIAVDTLGIVTQFQRNWTEGLEFAAPTVTVDLTQAQQAYFQAAYQTQLQYVPIPVKEETYGFQWVLGYQLNSVQPAIGVDPATGEVLLDNDAHLAYDDVAHCPEATILAETGVGFDTAQFAPQKALTQEAMLALLVSTKQEYQYDFSGEEARKELYTAVYRLGLLKTEEYAPEKEITRAELVRYLIDSIGYGKVAQLTGIYQASFADAAEIPQALYGYVAIAQGFGIIHGDDTNRFHPSQVATRAQAAVMLFNFLQQQS